MSNPLDPIWKAYQTVFHALKVVRRCATLAEIDRKRPFRNTRFHKLAEDQCVRLLDEAESEMNDLVVLSLYAAFEARVREHLAKQAHLLRGAITPDPQFGETLAGEFEEYCDQEQKMDRFAKLFAHAVGDALIAGVGNIRTSRHWVAHGRRGESPPRVAPMFAYKTLTAFLTAAKLA